MIRRSLILSFIALLFLSCAKDKLPKDALFKVGDKYVTAKEFQYRAEFTPHPNFPQYDRNLEKIFLNNLITEKEFVQEFGKSSELNHNENFQAYIQGRKEQAMREQLFYKKAYNVVKLNSDEIKKTFVRSQREYDLEFYSINNDSVAKKIKAKIQESPGLALQVFNSIMPEGKRPTWTAKWKDDDHIDIHEALFSGPLMPDSVIGPIQLDYDQWIFMKVVNWHDKPIISGEEQQLRQQEVVEKLTMNRATRNWDVYRHQVMKGKEIEFDHDMFLKLADLTYNMNRTDDKQQKADIVRRFWQMEDSTLTAADMPTDKSFLQLPFFTIDGITWTMGDFRKALMSHPLVYRRQALSRGQFYNEFRRAVADMVRDTYLNKEAYKTGLDKDMKVERTTELWSDALIASYERNKVLNELGKALPDTTDPYRQTKLNKAFDAYLADLDKKYQKKIRVNMELFDQIEFSKVQLFVMQQNSPYPVAMPSWPMFNNRNSIDYLPMKQRK
jgi:hypothetical protein